MGRTIEKVIVKNYGDILKFEEGIISEDKIRSVEVNAIVDTGATYMSLPPKAIKELGLKYSSSSKVKTGNGPVELKFFDGAKIFIRDRFTQMQVMENKSDDIPSLIGYLILEALDYVVNPSTQQLMGNPEHDGNWMAEMY